MSLQIIQALCLAVSGLPLEQGRAGLKQAVSPILEQLQATLQLRLHSAYGTQNRTKSALAHA